MDPSWERIGVTGNHPIWSEDRHDYIAAMDLRVGERLKNLSGDTVYVQQKLPRPGPTPVYNLEIQDEHVYFVGTNGVLAHNVGKVGRSQNRQSCPVDEDLENDVLSEVGQRSGVVKSSPDAEHHLFPQHRRGSFDKNYGIDVDDFVVDVDDSTHQALHAGKAALGNKAGWWDQELMKRIQAAEAAKDARLTYDEVLEVAQKMRKRFRLDHLPVHRYTKRKKRN